MDSSRGRRDDRGGFCECSTAAHLQRVRYTPDPSQARDDATLGMLRKTSCALHVLGAESDAYYPGGNSAQHRKPPQQFERPRQRQWLVGRENAKNYVVLKKNLQALGGSSWKHSAPLNGMEIVISGDSAKKFGAEDVCSRDRILYCQINSNPSDR